MKDLFSSIVFVLKGDLDHEKHHFVVKESCFPQKKQALLLLIDQEAIFSALVLEMQRHAKDHPQFDSGALRTGIIPRTRPTYPIGHVSKILGVSRRKILLYIEQGLITPTLPARQARECSYYSANDLLAISCIALLEDLGMAPRHIKKNMEQIMSGL